MLSCIHIVTKQYGLSCDKLQNMLLVRLLIQFGEQNMNTYNAIFMLTILLIHLGFISTALELQKRAMIVKPAYRKLSITVDRPS